MTPELLNEAFSVKATRLNPWKRHKEPYNTSWDVNTKYVVASAVTDKYTHKHTEWLL